MPPSARPHLKFVAMNCVAALAFMTMGIVLAYLGRDDPPQPILVTMFLVTLFLVCPFTCVLTALTLLRSKTSLASSISTWLNWVMCAFAILFALLSLSIAGVHALLGAGLIFLPFAVNIHALSAHREDPSSQRTGGYTKKK